MRGSAVSIQDKGEPEETLVTTSHLLGEMTWLLSQSPLHRDLRIADLEWLIMPPLIHKQMYIFRDEGKPVGLALWAKCDATAEEKIERATDGAESRLTLMEWNSGERIWLVEMIAPFGTVENKHREIMFADLVSGPLAGKAFKFHETDPSTGVRKVRHTPADAGAKLKAAIEEAISQQ
jgi:cytolysin-activating lysine-acyltransferase